MQQRTTHGLSPQLGAVTGSLDTSLDAKPTRYCRNRQPSLGREGVCQEDVCSSLESDPAFDAEPIEVTSMSTPPPVPPNKKLIAAGYYNRDSPSSNLPTIPFSTQQEADSSVDGPLVGSSSISASSLLSSLAQTDKTKAVGGEIVPTIVPLDHASLDQLTQTQHPTEFAQTLSKRTPSEKTLPKISEPANGYLASSKTLIKTLEDKSAQSNSAEPVIGQSRHKTISLLAGAVLGYLGFVAGLGAGYVVLNPPVNRHLANELTSPGTENTAAVTFDLLGPDLSSAEFVKLKIDNLSSLQMPRRDPITPITSGIVGTGQLPVTPSNPSGLSSAPAPAETSAIPSAASLSSVSVATETQAAVLPIGQTYYVTVPFTSEQALWEIRQIVSEAFVRRFADGNRVQVAAFDSAQSAKQFLEQLKENNIEAEVYGPTTE